MIVYLNDRQLEIFEGARVKDAVLKFAKEKYRAVNAGETIVMDKHNNPVEPDGELSDDQRLYLQTNKEFLK